jgi:F-box and WD-40 domain protein CDC4
MDTGNYVRELFTTSGGGGGGGECVWKVGFGKYVCAIMCKRAGKTVVEIWSLLEKNTKGVRKLDVRPPGKGDGALC